MNVLILLDRRIVTVILVAVLLLSGQSFADAAEPTVAGTEPPGVVVPTAGPTKVKSSIAFNHKRVVVRKGERIWLVGKVKQGTRVSAKRNVVVEGRKNSASPWKRVTTVRTRSNGKFTASLQPKRLYQYRVRVSATSSALGAISKPKHVLLSSGKRNLASRTGAIGKRLGKTESRVVSLSASQRKAVQVKRVRAVQYRKFSKGTLVKVVTAKNTRTWVVTGKIQAAYLAAGGPTGKYGVPIRDAKCGLLEGGCVQRFSKGTLYVNKSMKKAQGTAARGRQGEVVSAARSQVGYRRKFVHSSRQETKFNRFIGSDRAWCSFLQSWASVASGNRSLIPRSKSFTAFKSDVKKTMKTGKAPQVGALVFFNTYAPGGVATHVGLVVGVSDNRIRVVDGNTSGNLPRGYRGVLERSWPRSRALFYGYPNY